MKNLILGLFCISSFVFTSCEKDNNNSSQMTRSELLTSDSWELSAFNTEVYLNGVLTKSEDYYLQMTSCEQESEIEYLVNGIVNTIDNCVPGGEIDATDSWSFNEDETVLSIIEEYEEYSDTIKLDILTLNQIDLKWILSESFEEFGMSIEANMTLEFTH